MKNKMIIRKYLLAIGEPIKEVFEINLSKQQFKEIIIWFKL